jgi:AraC family transcriptional regulator
VRHLRHERQEFSATAIDRTGVAGRRIPLDVDSEVDLATAHVELIKLDHPGPSEHNFRQEDVYWLDLCLTPRRPNARARYTDEWGRHRFAEMGTIIAFPPRHSLHLVSAGGRHQSLVCQLRAEAVDKWLPSDFEWTDRRLEACLHLSNGTIRGLLLRMAQELRNARAGSRELCEAMALQLSIELARYITAVNAPREKGGLTSWHLRVIDRRVAEPGEPATLAELASLCNLSVRQITRGFRTSRGCSIGDYMTQSRIETAKRRLAYDESIKSVSASMGFSSASNFAYAFRRATGMTPTLYRSRLLRDFQ